jgi:hypothetical protein
MNAIKLDTTIDESVAQAIPALRPLLGKRVALTAVEKEPAPAESPRRKLTLDEFLASRLERPAGLAPVTLADMERAIVEGALGNAVR